MGKTITGLLEIAAAIAVQFIPGLGTIAGISIGLSLAATGLTTLLTKSPKPTTTDEVVKSPRPPRVSGYGENRLQGAYILFMTSSSGYAVDVWVYHDGRIDSVRRVYLGDRKITVLSSGFVRQDDSGNGEFGKNEDNVQVGYTLGEAVGTAFQQVISQVPNNWDTSHRGDGCVTGFMISKNVKSKNFQTIYPSGGPNQTPMSLAMRMQSVFDWRDPSQRSTDDTTWKWSENAILHLAHYLMVRMNRDWATFFAPTLAYWTAAANDADLPVDLTGVQSTLYVKASPGDTTVYLVSANGLHDGMTITIGVSGNNANAETRTITSVGLIGVYTQAYFSGGLSNLHPQGSEVDWTSDPANPATEPRYRSCVAHSHTDAHKDVLAHLVACSDAFLTPRSDGALVVYSGRYTAPTVSIGPDEIVSYSFQEGVVEESAVNTIKVTYTSANHDYNTVDTDDWIDEESIETFGKVLSDSLDNQVPSYSQARRLAKRAMAKIMAPYRGTLALNAAGRSVIGQRFIQLDLIEAGSAFFSGPIEVTKLTRNLQTGGVTIEWIAADPNVDAWDPATEEGKPAPISNRYVDQPIATPTISAAVADYSSVSDDGTGVRVDITAAGLNRDDVTWYTRWRVQGFASWNEQTYTDFTAGDSVQLITSFVPTGQTVEVEVAYGLSTGQLSDYSASFVVGTSTDTTPPDAAAAPTLVSWTNALNLQVDTIARASGYRWRFYDTTGALVGSHDTASRTISYTAATAALDGVRRAYNVKVSGFNDAGEGTAAITVTPFTLPAPAAVTSPAIAGGATEAIGTCDAASGAAGAAGYAVFYAATSGFNPMTTGGLVMSGTPSVDIFGLAAGTYYGHIAAYDAWTANPGFLNLSSEISFTITTGGGSTPSGGGTGGGGYRGVGTGPSQL